MTQLGRKIQLIGASGKASLAVQIMLREAKCSFEYVRIELDSGLGHGLQRTMPPDVLSVVPVLIVDGVAYRETLAMLLGISVVSGWGELQPTGRPLPYLAWLSYLATTVHPAFSQFARPSRFAGSHISDAIRHGARLNIESLVTAIGGGIEFAPFALGSSFTCLDALLVAIYRWSWRAGIDVSNRYPLWSKWADNVAKRASVKESLEADGISLFQTEGGVL